MKGYRFGSTCPQCSAPLDHVNAAQSSVYRSFAVARCTNRACNKSWQIVVEMITCGAPPATPRPLKESA